ncbi:MAG: D-aminoacyl-tRNA deacylase [candidate division NC10 bacterium]
MRAVIQRVRRAAVHVDEKAVGRIGPGLVVFLGVGKGDREEDVDWMVEKITHLRVFEDVEGRMDRSLLETGGESLVVSQFTLYGDVQKGRRPDFTAAAGSAEAEPLYHRFVQGLRGRGVQVQSGVFGARMQVQLENDGPLTLILATGDRRPETRSGL